MLENKAQNSSGKQALIFTKFHALTRVIKEGYSTFCIHEVRLTIAESAFQEHLCTPRNWRVL